MAQQNEGQRGTTERVMHEFKEGELTIGENGPKVKSRKQAIAIALHESGSTKQESPKKNAKNLRHTKAKEARGQTAEAEKEGRAAQNRTIAKGEGHGSGSSSRSGKTKDQLYAEAKRQGIEGRSKMDKAELQRALSH